MSTPTRQLQLAQCRSTAHTGSSANAISAPGASEGADLLWKYQLRKENAELYKKLETISKALEVGAADQQRRHQEEGEHVRAIEKRLVEIEEGIKQDKQLAESLNNRMSGLKRKLDAYLEGGIRDSELHHNLP